MELNNQVTSPMLARLRAEHASLLASLVTITDYAELRAARQKMNMLVEDIEKLTRWVNSVQG